MTTIRAETTGTMKGDGLESKGYRSHRSLSVSLYIYAMQPPVSPRMSLCVGIEFQICIHVRADCVFCWVGCVGDEEG
jgi:hypothetical protein